ncbi:hypothetical protein NQ314_000842, partial [Rhamnusium bicolor]
MYSESPQSTISLAEFEELALERLQLLRIIEQASLKGHKAFSDDWKLSIKDDLSKNGLKKYLRLMSGFSYCRSEDLRRWFLSREIEWFKLRFLAQSQDGVMKFLQNNNFTYIPISNEDKGELKVRVGLCVTDVSFDRIDFYKVPFAEVVPLVRNRKVFLQRGYAYIQTSDLVVCIQAKFRAGLSEALT